jgi:hypothetical protein
MNVILILIPLVSLALGRRLFVIISHVNKMEKGQGIVIRLTLIFYAEQALTLACVAVFLMAISPVEAAKLSLPYWACFWTC